jgi:hypothetical protein
MAFYTNAFKNIPWRIQSEKYIDRHRHVEWILEITTQGIIMEDGVKWSYHEATLY